MSYELINKIKTTTLNKYHIRAKGLPTTCIEKYCERKDITPLELYQKMLEEDFSLTLNLA